MGFGSNILGDMKMDTSKEDLELLTTSLSRYRVSEIYLKPYFTKWEENYELYKSYQKEPAKTYKHNIFVPYSFAFMEDATAYYMLSILASPMTFTILPRMGAVSPELCADLEQIVHWALTEESTEFVLELEDLIKNLHLYGVSYLINYPTLYDKKIFKNEKDSLTGEMVRAESTKSSFNNLHLNAPSTFDVYIQPNRKRLSRSDWVIKKSWDSFENLKKQEKAGVYKNVDEAKAGFKDDDSIAKLLNLVGLGSGNCGFDEKTQRVELLDCMEDGEIITIGGRRAIIQNTKKEEVKPYLFNFPILDCRTMGAPGEPIGISLIESFKPLQKELNILRSQRRDNISLILNKIFIYDMLAGEIDLDSLFSAPGNVILASGKGALDELEIKDVTGSAFKEAQDLVHDMESTTGMWPYARGATPRRRETATGIIRLQQAAQARPELGIRKLDEYILKPLCRRLIIYLREHLDRDDYEKIIGRDNRSEEFYNLTVDDIKRGLQIQPLTESISSIKEIDTNQFLQAYDRLIQMPDINRVALVKQLLLKLGQRNIKELLPQQTSRPAQELTKQTMADMQAAQVGGAPPGGRPPMPGPGQMPMRR